ncbi:MAG: hypothetical protein ACU0A9_14000 [Alterinioella nitratireducens]|uniref:hypothetical protein n=1 Tax=Alterinioella nitratireducens TaxID=2735915 RepID=UPI00405A1E9E
MADPMKSDEIEDVLSSIRRLVSEHHPAEGTQAVPPAGEGGDAAAPDKLVLTPALRVTDPEDPWVPITPRGDDPDPSRDEGTDWAQELWGEPVEDADAGDGAALADPVAFDDSPPLTDAEPEADMADVADMPEPDDDAPPEDEATDARAAPETGELANDIAEDDAVDAPDDSPPISFIRRSSSLAEYEPEEGAFSSPDEAPPFAARELAEARAAQMAVSGVLSAVISKGAREVEGEEDASAPDEVETEPQDAVTEEAPKEVAPEDPAPDLAADLEPEPEPEPRDRSEVEDLGEGPFTFPDEDAGFVDEETLREIVAEVVREELQGELGQRITRNVRKLVRREIRLALAADDLED